MQKEDINARSSILIGEDNLKILATKKVAVIGLGGVGSIIPIVLTMSNIKQFILVDFDKVSLSNLNRQIAYNLNDIDKYKVEAIKEKLNLLRNDLILTVLPNKIDENFNYNILKDSDYIIDCIDDINAKISLIKFAFNNSIPIVTSLGMGFRMDPSKVIITKLNKTTNDPLAKKLRYLLKKENVDISKINAAFSLEQTIIKGNEIGSMAFVPNSAGLNLASFVVQELLKKE